MHKLIFIIVIFASFLKIVPLQHGSGKFNAAVQIDYLDDESQETEESEKSDKSKSASEDKLDHHWYHQAVINSSDPLTLADSEHDHYCSYFSQPATPPPNSAS